MSTKPSTYAQWDTNSTNVSATTAGHKTDGWANNEIPTAGEFNYWQKQVSDWTQWLYDGDMVLRDVSVRDLTRSGSLWQTGILNYTLSGVVDNYALPANVSILRVTPGSNNVDPTVLWLTSIANGTDGRVLDIVNVYASGTAYFTLGSSTAGLAANRIDTNGINHIIIPPRGHVRLRYDGSLSRWVVAAMSNCYLEKTIAVSPLQVKSSSGTLSLTHPPYFAPVTGSVESFYPITLPQGALIAGWDLIINKTTDATHTVTAKLFKGSFLGVETQLGSTQTDAENNPGFTSFGQDPLASPIWVSSSVESQIYLAVTPGTFSSGALNLHTLVVWYYELCAWG